MTEKTFEQRRKEVNQLNSEIKAIIQKLEDNRLQQKLVHRNFASIVSSSTPWYPEKTELANKALESL